MEPRLTAGMKIGIRKRRRKGIFETEIAFRNWGDRRCIEQKNQNVNGKFVGGRKVKEKRQKGLHPRREFATDAKK